MKRLFPLFFLLAACGDQLDGRILDYCEDTFDVYDCSADGLDGTCKNGDVGAGVTVKGLTETSAEIYWRTAEGELVLLEYVELVGDKVRQGTGGIIRTE